MRRDEVARYDEGPNTASPASPVESFNSTSACRRWSRRSASARSATAALDAGADEPVPRAGAATTPTPRLWRTRLADPERAASEHQRRQGKRRRGASGDTPRLSDTASRLTVLAPFSVFWYSRARETQSGLAAILRTSAKTRATYALPNFRCKDAEGPPVNTEWRLERQIGVLTPFISGRSSAWFPSRCCSS
jgi:hypothetical protein